MASGAESGFSEVVVTVAAKTIDREGHLTLFKQSDTLYSVEFRDVAQRNVVKADIDSVHVDVKRQAIRIQEPDEDGDLDLLIDIPDRQHLQIFHDAQRECQEICNLTLELVTRLRDIYYAGVFRSIPAGSEVVVGSAAAKLLLDARLSFIGRCNSTRPIVKSPRRRKRSNGSAMSSSQAASGEAEEDLVGGELIAEDGPVVCFYCSCAEKGTKHFVHPYVPRNYELQPIFMCEQCIESWKYYRDLAMQDQQLVLPGEVNEEICAMCSDTPDMLILCNHCTRSYCEACLRRVANRKTVDAIVAQDANTNDGDWQCLSCAAKISRKPLLTREAWTRVEIKSKHFRKVSRRGDSDDEAHSPKSTHPRPRKLAGAQNGSAAGNGGSLSLDTKVSRFKFKREPKRPLEVEEDRTEQLQSADLIIYNREAGAESGRPSRRVMPSKKLREAIPLIKKRAASLPNPSRSAASSASAIVVNPDSNVASQPALAETGELLDETHYFSQYVLSLEVPPGPQTADQPTEDVCFLCKDGGDVIECDWRCDAKFLGGGRRSFRPRCMKVYHQGCLGYEVADNIKWHCPRHFCSVCGTKEIKFVCVFCPISICANCTEEFAAKFRLNRYCVMPSGGDFGNRDVVSIACESCMNLIRIGKERGQLERKFLAPSFAAVRTFRPSLPDEITKSANGHGNGAAGGVFVVLPPQSFTTTTTTSKADKPRRSRDKAQADLPLTRPARFEDPPTTEDIVSPGAVELTGEASAVGTAAAIARSGESLAKGNARKTALVTKARRATLAIHSKQEKVEEEGEELVGNATEVGVIPPISFAGKHSITRRHSTGSVGTTASALSSPLGEREDKAHSPPDDSAGPALAMDDSAAADESARLNRRVSRSRM